MSARKVHSFFQTQSAQSCSKDPTLENTEIINIEKHEISAREILRFGKQIVEERFSK